MTRSLIVAALLLTPVAALIAARTEPSPRQAGSTTSSSFDTMAANVAQITEPAEKQRWQANTDLWRMRLGEPGTLNAAELSKMKPLLDTMTANVSKVTEPGEKVRWQANCDLWQLELASSNPMSKTDLDRAKASLAHMKTNVAAIKAGAEKARWQANLDLWTARIR